MDFKDISFDLVVVGALGLCFYTSASPNPHLEQYHPDREKDSLRSPSPENQTIRPKDWLAKYALGDRLTFHRFALLSTAVQYFFVKFLFYDSRFGGLPGPDLSSNISRLVCLYPHNLSETSFTWSIATCLDLLPIYIGGLMRVMTYSQLGKSFTFRLNRPSKLYTAGLYRYMQHPSYTGALLVIWGSARFLSRANSLTGCWIPPASVLTQGWGTNTLPTLAFLVWLVMFMVRVRDEEDMLKQAFGEQWEQWHRDTSRFVPYLI
ncbi:hypothetical protein MMC09_000071 [Bachmanniomyces sp. S44760]|nr:hypothetical protein [Bachmanniomyces sp. S44760]